MSYPEQAEHSKDMSDSLIAYFWSGEAIRSRSVSPLLPHGTLDIPLPPARVSADWEREIEALGLGFGDIEPLPLARTIMRWPDYAHCAEAVAAWMQTQGLSDLLDPSDLALMACLGTPYHHDGEQYGSAAFCNLFLSEDREMDLHFPALGQRIPLTRGTVVIFDTAQAHAVIPRNSTGFDLADFAADHACTQVFLTWELPIENPQIQRALHIDFDIDPAGSQQLDEQKVCLNRRPLIVDPATGQWLPAD